MKKLFTTTVSLFMIVFAFGQSPAFQYMEKVGKEFKAVSKDMWDYTKAAAHGKSARTIDNRRKELIQQIITSRGNIKRMPSFEGDAAFRDSAASYLQLSLYILKEDFEKVIDMQEISEQSYDNMEAYMKRRDAVDEKMKQSSDMIEAEEARFAAANGITLSDEKSKLGKKMEEANRVYEYYNPIYLIFFKSYKNEMYLIEAQNKGDVTAMDKAKEDLLSSATEGLKQLEAIKDYKGDLSVKLACMEMLRFYQTEANKLYPDTRNFYVQKNQFATAKKEMEALKPQERTKQNVDQYNKAVTDYNLATTRYNQLNQTTNDTRSRLLNNWNKTSADFTDKHVPRGR